VPDVGRLGNRMWCYAASGVRPISPAAPIEDGIELLHLTPDELIHALATQQVTHALNFAAILLAVLKERFSLRGEVRPAPGR
jgi:hypothetical protein